MSSAQRFPALASRFRKCYLGESGIAICALRYVERIESIKA